VHCKYYYLGNCHPCAKELTCMHRLPALIAADLHARAIECCIKRDCIQELLGTLSNQSVTALSLTQVNTLIAAGKDRVSARIILNDVFRICGSDSFIRRGTVVQALIRGCAIVCRSKLAENIQYMLRACSGKFRPLYISEHLCIHPGLSV
jgi:hypothetical protein